METRGIIKINSINPFYWVCTSFEKTRSDSTVKIKHYDKKFNIFDDALKYAKNQPYRSLETDLVRKEDILPPVPIPRNFLGVAWNYKPHADETGYSGSPVFFSISPNAIASPFSALKTEGADLMDYEIELGVVIKRRVDKDFEVSDIHDTIAGYVLGNDITSRRIQVMHSGIFNKTRGFYDAKSLPNSKPLGPILFVDSIENINLELELLIQRGEIFEKRQASPISNMYLTPLELVSYLIESIRANNNAFRGLLDDNCLYPGDIILTGTPGGTAFQSSALDIILAGGRKRFIREELERNQRYLKAGDVIRSDAGPLGWQETRIV